MVPSKYLISVFSSILLASTTLLCASSSDQTLVTEYNRDFESRPVATPENLEALSANQWMWKTFITSNGAITIEQPGAYVLTFAKDGTLGMKADCNRASGTFKLDGTNLSIMVGPATLATCPGTSKSEQFLQLLGTAKSFAIVGNILVVRLNDGSSMMMSAPSMVDRCGDKVLEPTSLSDTVDQNLSGELDKVLAGFLTADSMAAPGVSMLVITPNGQYFKAVGVSDAAACTRLMPDSAYQIGSNTKMMTAAIIYQLQEKGRLSTSDKISKYLPELAAKLVNGKEITIEMLLTHTSGLADYFDVNTGDGGIAAGVNTKSILIRGYRPEELIQLVASSGKADFKPGQAGKWKYSNTGYILLGLIIENVTKKSYEENLKSRIFKPLGLKKTYLQIGQPQNGAIPQAYYQPPFSFTTSEWNASQGWSAGAVVSTSQEFAVFLKALFTGKLFKNKATLGLMLANPPASVGALGEGTVYGHGMLNNNGVLGHGGQTLGFQSDGGYIPNKDMTIVMWANSATNTVSRLAIPGIAGLLFAAPR
jgi:D-alanyl-D-alanine carboxypeptidase